MGEFPPDISQDEIEMSERMIEKASRLKSIDFADQQEALDSAIKSLMRDDKVREERARLMRPNLAVFMQTSLDF